MQEINLLQNKLKDTTNQWEKHNRVIVIILVLVLIVEAIGGGMFYMLKLNAQDATVAMDQDNANIQKALDQMEGQLKAAKGFQAQTKNISMLLQTHVIWSDLMKGIADKAYKGSRFVNISAGTDGLLNIEGMVPPDYSHLGKLILGLRSYDTIQSVKLLQSTPSEDQEAGIRYSLEVRVNPQAFLTKN